MKRPPTETASLALIQVAGLLLYLGGELKYFLGCFAVVSLPSEGAIFGRLGSERRLSALCS
jgi:hypothetical protein